jgi:uncharacterized protein
MNSSARPFAVVTGASTGIGYELARECIENGFDVLIAADEPQIQRAAETLRQDGARVEAVQANLVDRAGVDKLYSAVGGRTVDALLANAGRGLGGGFLDQEPDDWQRVVDTNVTGTLLLIHRIAQDMRRLGRGRILLTGSIAGFIPGTYQAVYNASKAFLDSFSFALRHELNGSGVSVTCLMPGATETDFFERAEMLNTKVGQAKKDDPVDVARQGFDAMMKGKGDVVTGWLNKLQSAIANITPADMLAEQHRRMAQPRR